MTVKFISEKTKEARLANNRVVLIRDETCHDSYRYGEEVFGLLIEKWNNEERQFKIVDAFWGLYGFDDVKDNIIDNIVGNYDIDCFVVGNELGDPENWKDEFREFDVVDF